MDCDHIWRELAWIKSDVAKTRNTPLSRAEARSLRFMHQCEVLALLHHRDATLEAIIPILQIALACVFGKRPSPITAKCIVKAYRKNMSPNQCFDLISEPAQAEPTTG